MEEEIEEQPAEPIDELVEELKEIAEDEDDIEEIEEEAVEEVIEESVEDVVEDIIEELDEEPVDEEVIEEIVEDIVEDDIEEVDEEPVKAEDEPEEDIEKAEPIIEAMPEAVVKLGGKLQITLLDVPGDVIPYGYNLSKDKLVINEDEAMKVKVLYSWFYGQKKSLEEISAATRLTIEQIEEILGNPIYFGKIFYEDTLQLGDYPPILTEIYCRINKIDASKIEEEYLSSKA
ncbi:unnamed protein product [marine sediment metagenome]|uniref:Uncharacterized protein n=1 Tax=marine sediment metagenome TaxID=412755 RepID=X1I7Y4_9ZZZZ